jgi:hypothetical protein
MQVVTKNIMHVFYPENEGSMFLRTLVSTYMTVLCHNKQDHNPNVKFRNFVMEAQLIQLVRFRKKSAQDAQYKKLGMRTPE